MKFEEGHYRGDQFVRFPHRCPGATCAIMAWLRRQFLRGVDNDT